MLTLRNPFTTTFSLSRKPILLSILLAGLGCSQALASVTNSTWNMTGGIYCDYPLYLWYDNLDVEGGQSGSAILYGDIYTDTPEDPTLTLNHSLDNDTSFAWTSYHIEVRLNAPFTLADAMVAIPGGWTATYNPSSTYDGGLGLYVDDIYFTAGTVVNPNDLFEFSYEISFAGAVSFALTEIVTPIPEPGVLSLLAAGSLLFRRLRVAQRQQTRGFVAAG